MSRGHKFADINLVDVDVDLAEGEALRILTRSDKTDKERGHSSTEVAKST